LDSSAPLHPTPSPSPQEDCGLLLPPILSPCSGPYLLPIDLRQPNPGMDVGWSSLQKIKDHRCTFILRLSAITLFLGSAFAGGRRAHRQRSRHYCNTERDMISPLIVRKTQNHGNFIKAPSKKYAHRSIRYIRRSFRHPMQLHPFCYHALKVSSRLSAYDLIYESYTELFSVYLLT
jgi:hypothetical protein